MDDSVLQAKADHCGVLMQLGRASLIVVARWMGASSYITSPEPAARSKIVPGEITIRLALFVGRK